MCSCLKQLSQKPKFHYRNEASFKSAGFKTASADSKACCGLSRAYVSGEAPQKLCNANNALIKFFDLQVWLMAVEENDGLLILATER